MTKQQEDKAAFFAQYYNQFVMKIPSNSDRLRVFDDWIVSANQAYIELRPLSAITDEDCVSIASLYGWDAIKETHPSTYNNRILQFKVDIPSIGRAGYMGQHRLEVYDFLRSRGYLIPFRNYSTDQILEMGWAKLKES